MRHIGFSTGSLALSDFRKGLNILVRRTIRIVELSALREEELVPLLEGLSELDLSSFSYVSFHAPSRIDPSNEAEIVTRLEGLVRRRWPIIIHPDAITRVEYWTRFKELLCVENMDKRKPGGRTVRELRNIFEKLPEASLCFDIGHARQVDPTMGEAMMILRTFGKKVRQVHISEVNSQSRHDPLTFGAIQAFRRVSHLIPEAVPIVIESRVSEAELAIEVSNASKALTPNSRTIAQVPIDGRAGMAAGD